MSITITYQSELHLSGVIEKIIGFSFAFGVLVILSVCAFKTDLITKNTDAKFSKGHSHFSHITASYAVIVSTSP